MNDLTARIAEVRALAEKASDRTDYQWKESAFLSIGFRPDDAKLLSASRELVPTLLKALEHEMETSNELRTDSLPWVMRYDCTRTEYLEKRRAELSDLLDGRANEGRN